MLREVRTLAKLESPYIVRYFYSWFEYPPFKWQQKVDKILLKSIATNEGIDTNTFESGSTNITNSNTGFSNFNTNSIISKKFGKQSSSSGVYVNGSGGDNTQSSTSSFIVFQNDRSKIDETVEEEEDDSDDSSSFADKEKEIKPSNRNDNKKSKIIKSDSQFTFESSDEEEEKSPKEKIMDQNKMDNFFIYIQMELCQRETLRHWLDIYKDEKRERIQILSIFDQILHAISYIHSQELIHRDLKVFI